MKRALLKLTGLVCTLISVANTVNAQSTSSINVVTSAVPFLRISPDARSGGMGDVGIATTADVNSTFWNSAKNPFNTQPGGISVTYTPWLKDLGLNDVYLASLSGYYKLDDIQAISGSLRYFSLGNIQFTNEFGEPLQSYKPREFAFSAGYSRKLSEKLSLGIDLRYINSSLANNVNGQTYKPASAFAGDISVFHNGVNEAGNGLSYGVVLSNLGSKISYTNDATQKDYIPANLGIGIAYTKTFDEMSKINFGLDINKLMVPTPPGEFKGDITDSAQVAAYSDKIAQYRSKGPVSSWFSSFGDAPDGFSEELKEFQISVGGEYWYNDQFAFRAGYFYENPNKGNRKYFTLGAGLKYNTFGLNFSYLLPTGQGITRNPLSNTLRFSLNFDLGGGGSTEAATPGE